MQLSGYHVQDIIGKGGMATVYRAEHILLKQERALKIMSPELTNHPGFKESFIREGQIVAALKHPNIITIYDIEERDGHYFMAMEYLHGGNLKERLEKSSLSLTTALQIFQQIGSALHHAHQQNLIHRDIKPANILFNTTGDATLTDFGISKLQNTDSDLTQHGYGLLGTPRYMSPEQATGKVLDARSDLYSLALVFYELLTGKSAINADNMGAIIHAHTSEPPPKLPDTIKFLQPVLNKALATKANERYADIPAFLDAVTTQLTDDKTQLLNRPITSPAQRSKRKSKHNKKQKTAQNTKSPSLLLRFAILFTLLGGMAGIEWWRTYHPQQWQALFHLQQNNNQPIVKEKNTTKPKIDKPKEIILTKHQEDKLNNDKEIHQEKKQIKIEKNQEPLIRNISKQENKLENDQESSKKENNIIDNQKELPEIVKELPKITEKPNKPLPKQSSQKTSVKIVRVTPYIKLYSDLGNIRIGQIKKGSKVKVIEQLQSPDGKWWNKIEFNEREGYVIASKLKNHE